MSDEVKKSIIWIVAAFFLVIISDFLPKFTIWLVILLLLSVLLINSDKYTQLINDVNKTISGK